MEENKNLENLEQATVVENSAETVETTQPASEPVVQTKKVDEAKLKVAKTFFGVGIFLLVLMAFRFLTGIGALENTFLCLRNTDSGVRTIGVLSLIEIIFMVANFAMAVVLFIFANKYKKSVQNCEAQYSDSKTFKLITLITSVLYTIFFVYEVFAVIKMAGIVASLELELSISYASLVWCGAFAGLGWYMYILQTKNKI